MKINPDKVDEALEQFIESVGYEHALRSITVAMPTSDLKETLEFIFRMEDFDSSFLEKEENDEEEDND